LTGISIQPLMKDALNKDLLEGRGNVRLDITTGGSTVNGLKKNLDGSGAIMLRDGAFKGINIGAKLRQAQALLGRGGTETQLTSASEKTDFTELTASFTINNGIATSNDLDVKSPLLRISGAGQVDIPASTLDYTVRAMVVNTATGQEGKELAQLRGVTIPVKLSGPFDKLSYSIDWTSAAQEALKSRAAEQLKDKATPQLDEQKKKLEQRVRDAFKGLLGR
jgi:AsmA protein